MDIIAEELYDALKTLIADDGDFSHCETSGFIDYLLIGDEVNKALDLLEKYSGRHETDSVDGEKEREG